MDDDLDDALEREARETNRSKSAVVRDLVREKVKRFPPIEEDPLWEMVGVDDYEPTGMSIDEYLYGPYTSAADPASRVRRKR